MTTRARLWTFAGIVGACLVAGCLYFVWLVPAGDSETTQPARVFSPLRVGDTVIRSLDRRHGTFGELAVVTPGKPRVRVGLVCDRVSADARGGLCLARAKAFGVKYDAVLFGATFAVRDRIRLDGSPSRTRLSPDGRYASVTAFVGGHSYAELGKFSTQTLVLDRVRGDVLFDLEELSVTKQGRRLDAVDVNYWGVTFTPSGDRFYATLATGGHTYLISASIASRRAQVLLDNVECPSLSPEGTHVAYKKRVGKPAVWRFHTLELATMRQTPLAETRPIDDQIEWLDNERVLYRVDEEVWVSRADGTGTPQRYLPRADSPAVIRR